ncbi:MAG TPA: heavy metal-responsive transcriptional regulator, partial [Planctomycetes bacterium]|nr:heavy metal-responsive transcriptional regulator [Planctomycetota bacterium]
ETIRYYERRGLIPDPRPKKVGYREFSSEDVRRVRFVKQAQALGFTLKEIAELLALRVSPATTCEDVRTVARAKLQDIEEKLEALQTFKRALGALVEQCVQDGPASGCPILDAIDASATEVSTTERES